MDHETHDNKFEKNSDNSLTKAVFFFNSFF